MAVEKKKDPNFMTRHCHTNNFLLVVLLIAIVLSPLTSGRCFAAAPDKMPEFTLASAVDDSAVDSKQYSGKVLLVNFWATWCGPCREEIPSLIKLREDLGKDGFEVIGIAMDEGGRTAISRFSEKAGITYPLALGTPKVARAFGGIIGIPQSFLVDREGKIVKSYAGLIDHDVLEQAIMKLVAR